MAQLKVSSVCAVTMVTGIMLFLATHHGDPSATMSVGWVHVGVDLTAIVLIACPLFSWLKG